MVDIVIPLYNGYSFFKECFESVLKNTNPDEFRIIIINDFSAEIELLKYLKKIENYNYENVIVLKNETNQGFVKSVNNGMRYSQNDIILLNSDTIVTHNWLNKMISCAYSDPRIATVSPLTNNGTICSVPSWLQNNIIPDGLSLETYAKLIEDASTKEYPELPTAVGFCMYIKRGIIDKIGFFDAESYGRGYGEENDFSQRAIKYGYKNVLDDATFIYHKGHMSFSSEDFNILTKKNALILSDKYPNYNKDVEDFTKKQSLGNIINRINSAIEEYKKSNILYFIHSNPHITLGGGEKHTLQMIQIAKGRFNFVYLLYFDDASFVLERYSRQKSKATVLRLRMDYKFNPEDDFSEDTPINIIIDEIISFYNIQNIHFQHIFKIPISIIKTASNKGAKVYLTMHDYYFYCPYPHLFNQPKTNKLAACLGSDCDYCTKHEFSKEYIETRRKYISNLFKNNIAKVIFPSNYLKEFFVRNYPESKDKFILINHPYFLYKPLKNEKAIKIKNSKKVLAFIGSFSPHKGSGIFTKFVLQNKNSFIFYIFGKIEDGENFNKIKQNVYQKKFSNINELEDNIIKSNTDIAFLLSIVPETFSFTLSELLLINIPIIASKVGAITERCEHIKNIQLFTVETDTQKTLSNIKKAILKLSERGIEKNLFNLTSYNDKIIKQYEQIY